MDPRVKALRHQPRMFVLPADELPVGVAQHKIHAADGGNHVRYQGPFYHSRHGLQVPETRSPHMYAIRVCRPVAHYVIADFAAWRFDRLVDFSGGHAEALRHNLEMVDER